MSKKAAYFGSALRYSLLPGIVPRVTEFFASGFAHLAFFMAHVYGAVKLLPPGHAYLQYQNMGRYGVWNVIGEARRNLHVRLADIDKIVVFCSLFVGVILLVLQFAMFALSLFIQSAWATGDWWARFLLRPDRQNDLAYVTLDRVFGIPGMFNSRVSTEGNFPTPFHLGLQDLFQFYSIGLFAVAIIIIIYYVITIVAETATSGTPFGRRFNGAWAPVRLMLAIFLLAPIHHGMNIAQLGTLRIAKGGSNLATNAWEEFNTAVGTAETALGRPESLIAMPNNPDMNTFFEFLMVAKTCQTMYRYLYDKEIEAYVVHDRPPGGSTYTGAPFATLNDTGFDAATAMANNDMIIIVFGEQNDEHIAHTANIRPYCGILGLKLLDNEREGTRLIQQTYYEIIQNEWGLFSDFENYGEAIALRFVPTSNRDPGSDLPVRENLEFIRDWNIGEIRTALTQARQAQINDAEWLDFSYELGWASAGMWYNKIAQYNGTFFHAVFNQPSPISYPEVMEYVRERRAESEEQVQPRDRYRPYRADREGNRAAGPVEFRSEDDLYLAQALYFAQTQWFDFYIPSQQSPLLDYINMIFGTTGLFNMRENIDNGIHPLAALVGIGSSLVESTVVNLGAMALGGVMGGIGHLASVAVMQTLGQAIAGVSFQIAMLGLSLGFILFYVLPFLPFIYFFFAFSGWIKAIFEAMVGLPLWALAHLRIDGEGISGPMALDGLFLVLEIFVRPIVILIGLLSSVIIFSAMVSVLNNFWDLVITNLVGNRPPQDGSVTATPTTTTGVIEAARNTVDFLFFTVIYAIIVYMIGLSSFKMIDMMPNYTLRWLGKSIKTFGEGDMSEDPGQSVLRNMFTGSQVLTAQIGGGGRSVIGSLMGRNGD